MNHASALSHIGATDDLRSEQQSGAQLSTALWVFMAVASVLFLLFLAADVMRMNGADWAVISLPRELYLSTVLLCGASCCLHLAYRAAWKSRCRSMDLWLALAGLCGVGFLVTQLLAWQALALMQVRLAGNPSGSFFYLLTAMHGLHVMGGLLIYALSLKQLWGAIETRAYAWQIALCARYWHFLLAVWLVLYAVLSWLTPQLVQAICGIR